MAPIWFKGRLMFTRDATDGPQGPDDAAGLGLLRLLQLCSPALPIGAYAYSRGLEQAVSSSLVSSAGAAQAWIEGQLGHSWARLEVPLLARFRAALKWGDWAALEHWLALSRASRESAELAAEDAHLGSALMILLPSLDVPVPPVEGEVPFALAFAAAALHWNVPLQETALAFLWIAAEHQVSAAVRLVPLGQTDGQRILLGVASQIPAAARAGLSLPDEDMGAVSPGLALLSAQHETLYSRLFRS